MQAKALALVDCVQDTYSNVAALIGDSVYNMEGGMEEDLEKMVLDLSRVDKRVTTIVAGVRSLSMTFKVSGCGEGGHSYPASSNCQPAGSFLLWVNTIVPTKMVRS